MAESIFDCKKKIHQMFRTFGFDLIRYNPPAFCDSQSSDWRILECPSVNFVRLLKLKNIDLVFDIGANLGNYAISLFAMGYAGRVVSVEPIDKLHKNLLQTSCNNSNWEIAERCALGDAEGEVSINVSANYESSSILPILDLCTKAAPEARYLNSELVHLHMLDVLIPKYIKDCKAPFLKLDVQGYEHKVLDGAKNIMSKIMGMQIELSFSPLYEGQLLFKDMLGKMESYGFELYALIPGFTDTTTGKVLQMDGVFFRSSID